MRVCYLSILGQPGTYDASVYAEIPGGDDECAWIRARFAYLSDVEILGARVSHGEAIPAPESADAFILGGSYNSVHDDFPWQRALLAWFAALRAAEKPLLGICGGHQLMSRQVVVRTQLQCLFQILHRVLGAAPTVTPDWNLVSASTSPREWGANDPGGEVEGL